MNDELLRMAKAGSAAAMNDLIACSQRYVFAVVKGFLGRRYQAKLDVEDVVQVTLMEVSMTLVSRCKADNYHAYLRWLSCVARSVTYKEIERLSAQKRAGDLAVKSMRCDGRGSDIRCLFLPGGASCCPSVERAFFVRETISRMIDMAESESRNAGKVMEAMIDGVRIPQIASELGMSRSTVYKTASRVRKMVFSSGLVASVLAE
ncbi:RNA polymerase sigma factor [Pirellulaceae bacterium SH501]